MITSQLLMSHFSNMMHKLEGQHVPAITRKHNIGSFFSIEMDIVQTLFLLIKDKELST